jgi:hypothetical protein
MPGALPRRADQHRLADSPRPTGAIPALGPCGRPVIGTFNRFVQSRWNTPQTFQLPGPAPALQTKGTQAGRVGSSGTSVISWQDQHRGPWGTTKVAGRKIREKTKRGAADRREAASRARLDPRKSAAALQALHSLCGDSSGIPNRPLNAYPDLLSPTTSALAGAGRGSIALWASSGSLPPCTLHRMVDHIGVDA